MNSISLDMSRFSEWKQPEELEATKKKAWVCERQQRNTQDFKNLRHVRGLQEESAFTFQFFRARKDQQEFVYHPVKHRRFPA